MLQNVPCRDAVGPSWKQPHLTESAAADVEAFGSEASNTFGARAGRSSVRGERRRGEGGGEARREGGEAGNRELPEFVCGFRARW